LAVLTIWLPPLRDRLQEIAPLARARLDELERRCGRRLRLTVEALAALEAHHWPGNVRELLNTVERGWINSVADEIHAADLELQPHRNFSPAVTTYDELLREFERRVFWSALEAAGGERRRAARLLGISEQHFHRRLRMLAAERKALPNEFARVALDASHAELMKEFERNLLLSALKACGGQREQAASRLALAARRLYRRLHALGVTGHKRSSASVAAAERAAEGSGFCLPGRLRSAA
jgi:DNA-binding NtrC family response regulator